MRAVFSKEKASSEIEKNKVLAHFCILEKCSVYWCVAEKCIFGQSNNATMGFCIKKIYWNNFLPWN